MARPGRVSRLRPCAAKCRSSATLQSRLKMRTIRCIQVAAGFDGDTELLTVLIERIADDDERLPLDELGEMKGDLAEWCAFGSARKARSIAATSGIMTWVSPVVR